MKFLIVKNKDLSSLSTLAKKSKAYWNYDPSWLSMWDADLTLTEEYLENSIAYQIFDEDHTKGFYAYHLIDDESAEIDFLFVDPIFIGEGIGHALLQHAERQINTSKVEEIIVEADPNAASFYKKYGYETIGQVKSSIPDRYLPIMRKRVKVTAS